MAHRNRFGEDFRSGFDWGYNLAGRLRAQGDINDLEDEQAQEEFDPNTYATDMGLQPDSQQAAMLQNQDAAFGMDAARSTAAALNTAAGDSTPANEHMKGSWSYLGQTFTGRPTEQQRDWVKERKKADIYEKYGLHDLARQARSDAIAGRTASELSQMRQMQIDEQKRKEAQRKQMKELARAMKAANSEDPATRRKGIRYLLINAKPIYNDPSIQDDDNSMVLDQKGNPMAVTPNGTAIDMVDKVMAMKPKDRQEALRRAMAYSQAAITGDLTPVTQYLNRQEDLGLRSRQVSAQEATANSLAALRQQQIDEAKAKQQRRAAMTQWMEMAQQAQRGDPSAIARVLNINTASKEGLAQLEAFRHASPVEQQAALSAAANAKWAELSGDPTGMLSQSNWEREFGRKQEDTQAKAYKNTALGDYYKKGGSPSNLSATERAYWYESQGLAVPFWLWTNLGNDPTLYKEYLTTRNWAPAPGLLGAAKPEPKPKPKRPLTVEERAARDEANKKDIERIKKLNEERRRQHMVDAKRKLKERQEDRERRRAERKAKMEKLRKQTEAERKRKEKERKLRAEAFNNR